MILTIDIKGKITTEVYVRIDGTYDFTHIGYHIMLKYISTCIKFEIEYKTLRVMVGILHIVIFAYQILLSPKM